MVLVLKVWKPSQVLRLDGDTDAATSARTHTTRELLSAWSPYILLVVSVLLWRFPPVQALLNAVSVPINVPGLHYLITRLPPMTAAAFDRRETVQPLSWSSCRVPSCRISSSSSSRSAVPTGTPRARPPNPCTSYPQPSRAVSHQQGQHRPLRTAPPGGLAGHTRVASGAPNLKGRRSTSHPIPSQIWCIVRPSTA